MNSIKLNKALRGFAILFAMAFGMVLVTGTDVSAQNRDYRDYRNDRRDDRYNRDDRDNDRNDDRYDNDRYNGRDRNGNQSVRFAY